jgi:uncharacterized membrane protein
MINPQLEIKIDGLTLYALYGNVCLGLRHPGNQGGSRLVALSATRRIGALLVGAGVITDKMRLDHEEGL